MNELNTSSESTVAKSNSIMNESKDNISEEKQKDEQSLKDFKIGFVGAGKLTGAIVSGIIKYANISPKNIYISAKSDENLSLFLEKGCNVTKRNYDIFARFDCDIVFLCFHGSVIRQCYRLGSAGKPMPFTVNYIPVSNHKLYILSLVSGVSLDEIIDCLINPLQLEKFSLEVHRLVLNTSVAYGSASGLGAIDVIPEACNPLIIELLSKISILEYLPESEMDSFCASSSSGLPISYYFCSALVNAGIDLEVEKILAIRLSALTLKSAAQVVLKSNKSPIVLTEECISISSPALIGFERLKESFFKSAVENAIEAIHRRAQLLQKFFIPKLVE